MEAERIAPLEYWAEDEDEPEERSVAVSAHRAGSSAVALIPALTSLPNSTFVEAERRGTCYQRYWKRALDMALGIPLFVAAAPVIGITALTIVLTSGWPVFYKTRRLGVDGREFTMWKLRSMVKDADALLANWRTSNPELTAEYDANFKLRSDPRVTPIGHFIRRTSIDELPQFWNVLRGEMSLVGPRPYYAHELAPHPHALENIIKVRPGVTGPWQVAGRNSLSPAERMFLDRTYVNTCCFRTDLEMLLSTCRILLNPNGY